MTHSPSQHSRLFGLLSVVLAASICLPLPGRDGRIANLPSVCPFHELTGLPCPGCGLTRAFVCLGHGQLTASLHWHPLGWLVYAALLAFWARAGVSWALNQDVLPLTPTAAARSSAIGASLLLIVGMARLCWFLVHPSLHLP